jgi:hypothetical protein
MVLLKCALQRQCLDRQLFPFRTWRIICSIRDNSEIALLREKAIGLLAYVATLRPSDIAPGNATFTVDSVQFADNLASVRIYLFGIKRAAQQFQHCGSIYSDVREDFKNVEIFKIRWEFAEL